MPTYAASCSNEYSSEVYHMTDGKLTGWNHVTYANGDTVTLRMTLAKK